MPGQRVQIPKGRLLVRRPDLETDTPGSRVQIYTDLDADTRVIVGMEPYLRDNVPRLHVSVSHPNRLPDWEEIKAIKAAFFGDVEAMIVLPRKGQYVNVHQYCHHLWESPDAWCDPDD